MPIREWQPIESAPSGVELLVHTPRWGAIIALRSEEYGAWLSRMQVPVTLGEEDQPTHWQELPPPPEAGREPGAGAADAA